MREVRISKNAGGKIRDLLDHLVLEQKLSEQAVDKYLNRMQVFLEKLRFDADYALCRFERWRQLGYRCVVFEKDWVFAYQTFPWGVIIRDMTHAANLKN